MSTGPYCREDPGTRKGEFFVGNLHYKNLIEALGGIIKNHANKNITSIRQGKETYDCNGNEFYSSLDCKPYFIKYTLKENFKNELEEINLKLDKLLENNKTSTLIELMAIRDKVNELLKNINKGKNG